MGLLRLKTPTEFPVSTDDARMRLRIDDVVDDVGLALLIASATRAVENKTQRALVSQKWEFSANAFPSSIGNFYNGFPNPSNNFYDGVFFKKNCHVISLPLPPLQSVESITYIDTNGVQQTIDPADYIVDISTFLGSVSPAYGKRWPVARNQPMSVRIAFTAGYGEAAECEPDLIMAILLLIGHYDQNREAVVDVQMYDLPQGVNSLVAPYIVPSAP